MNYTVHLDHELKIIRYKHTGVINEYDIGEAWEEFLKLKEFTDQKYNLLSDYRDAKFNMQTKTAYEIVEFLKSIKHILKGKKQSLIIDDPYETAISIIFEKEVNPEIGFEVKVFSTEEAALNWVVL